MRRIYSLLLVCCLTVGCWAQTQQGYVKTLGRPDKKGVALNGVSVRVKGGHNAVLSQQDGTFSMLLTGKKNGDSYQLQQVQKAGYELNEKGVLGRQYAFSDKVPLTIVMVSTAQLQADKQRIENNAYQVAEKNYKAKLSLLEKQREEQTITAEQYREELQDLQDKFEKYQSLIDDLSDHYAHVDYDNLVEQEREINLCIENGDLERADSLIHLLFDPVNVLKRNKEALSKIEEQMAQAQALRSQANEDMAVVLKQQEKDAEHLYQLYTIALAKFDNEKAAHYIEIRAALDTTNVEWQNQAGQFIESRQGDYSLALSYYQRVLRQSLLQYGEESEWTASGYNNIGLVYDEQGEYTKAMDFIQKAMIIREKVLEPEHLDVAQSYNNIGSAYYYLGDNTKALEYLQKAQVIYEKVLGSEHPDVIAIQKTILAVVSNSYQNLITAINTPNEDLETISRFRRLMSECCFIATILDGDCPARQQGMTGEYILIEFADWNQDSTKSLFDKNDELRGLPKDLVVMKDGVISCHHFENTIGAQLGIKYVGIEERQRINKVYEEWKHTKRI